VTDKQKNDDRRQTDDNRAINSTVTQVRPTKNVLQS